MVGSAVDVAVLGAGISGIGMACHLQKKCPEKTFLVLDRRASLGGTWDLFRYPGVRSDSDMHTLAYSFKPWTGKDAIVEGGTIKNYLEAAAQENGVSGNIVHCREVVTASWDSAAALWTIGARNTVSGEMEEYQARFLAAGTGYFRYDHGYSPQFEGESDFDGEIVHPQKWPDNLNYSGKQVVVIGSGATAITIGPAMACQASHVTLLQRSPTYVASRSTRDSIANALHAFLPATLAHRLIRIKNIWMQQYVFNKSKADPKYVRQRILSEAAKQIGKACVESHFTPRYDPWDQRICAIPDNDLFNCIKDGSVSVVTDEIERILPHGIQLKSGQELAADIIVTATGLELQHLGGIQIHVDGRLVDMASTYTYKGIAYCGVPNLVSSFGYFNASWTMKVDLTADYLCRLIHYMDKTGATICAPSMPPAAGPEADASWIEGFSSGYIQRGIHLFPKQKSAAPWVHTQSYDADRKLIQDAPVNDGVMKFTMPASNEVEG